MLGSPVLGAAVGLILLFATTALLCSGITESLSNVFQLRAKYLLTGLRTMLDGAETERDTSKRDDKQLHEDVKNPNATKTAAEAMRTQEMKKETNPQLTMALFNSPLLTSLQSRRVAPFLKGRLRNPQYVSGRTFARALVDLLVPAAADGQPPIVVGIATLRAAVMDKLPEQLPLRRQLLAFLATAGDDVEIFEAKLEQWYDEEMAKISGWYKRWARVALGITGFVIAVALNLDTLQVARSLYVDAPVQQAVLATANTGTLCQNITDLAARNQCTTDELATLKAGGVPIGWADQSMGDTWSVALKLLGWVITAFAVSFGAPFWFEALSKLGSLRNTGTRPQD